MTSQEIQKEITMLQQEIKNAFNQYLSVRGNNEKHIRDMQKICPHEETRRINGDSYNSYTDECVYCGKEVG